MLNLSAPGFIDVDAEFECLAVLARAGAGKQKLADEKEDDGQPEVVRYAREQHDGQTARLEKLTQLSPFAAEERLTLVRGEALPHCAPRLARVIGPDRGVAA